ncbi:hypothetical protein BL124_00004270 [Klebsiella pneumoniae]|uniref:Uncharacterized protein n=1 Tax=Klebsiella pneumoniae TaxID=573 RepID=A0A422ZZU7_KLEPN|nr:hypothetical protein BL124_00004270 [Klebsiella pneumoniae]HBY0033142.1 hypothetical protein [Klebsiella pneumoniae]
MLGALFDACVAVIGADDVLVAVQQFVDLGDIPPLPLYLTVCGEVSRPLPLRSEKSAPLNLDLQHMALRFTFHASTSG